jgi:hypothetical protein
MQNNCIFLENDVNPGNTQKPYTNKLTVAINTRLPEEKNTFAIIKTNPMAQKLYDFFLKAGELGGVQARTRLSIISKMTSTEAKSMADSDDKIKTLEQCFQIVAREFGKNIGTKAEIATVAGSSNSLIEKLRSQMSIFADLTATRFVYGDDLAATAKRITEALVDAINVERASIWLYNDKQDAIECLDLFVRTRKEHSTGVILKAIDFPNYFNPKKSLDFFALRADD